MPIDLEYPVYMNEASVKLDKKSAKNSKTIRGTYALFGCID